MVAWFSVPREGLRWLGDAPRRFGSSAHAWRGFCADCGNSLTFESQRWPDEIDLTTASLDAPEAMPSVDHTHSSSRLPCVVLADGLPQHGEQRTP